MSSKDIAVSVRGLSKSYTIAHNAEKHTTLAEVMLHRFKNPVQRAATETFWALKDVEFDIQKGDVVGIIGRNGAGKSTLLKILSQITEPTAGEINLYGRVGSLLEVGTGFHPELTGRENVFLNGAILGMRKSEIQRQFDAIVDFAEVEQFLDTPVKRYSSGMYVRLAFAVAAHLNPEILIIDEVLAVGDATFQKKCLGKMKDVAEGGRTILFVSHNISAVTTLCNRAIFLANGQLQMKGGTAEVTSFYQTQYMESMSMMSDIQNVPRKGTGAAKFTSIEIKSVDGSGKETDSIYPGSDVLVRTKINCIEAVSEVNVAVIIYDINNYHLVDMNTALVGEFVSLKSGQQATVEFLMSNVLLRPGTYLVGLWIGRGGIEDIDMIEHAVKLDVLESPIEAKHVEVFKGPYQCKFESKVDYSLIRNEGNRLADNLVN